MTTPRCAKYSCASAAETLEWMSAIAFFLNPYKPLIDSHVVNFFKDRLWELVDDEWLRCLREEPVENLLRIPSGLVMEHWPVSLREFVLTIRSLVISRCQELPHQIFPDMLVPSLSSVLAQGMNTKKKHEVETLAAVVSVIASSVGAETVIDVGSGQGYLAQVLSFQYQLPVVAIDASSHHSSVTSARSERIKRHYAAKLRRSQSESRNLKVPCAVTCHVLSSSTLSALSIYCLRESFVEHDADTEKSSDLKSSEVQIAESDSGKNRIPMASLVLAGLHACGDLSVNMLRTFSECEQVKGLVCVGCCYNLLSEEGTQNFAGECGFPMSIGGKLSDLFLGKNARDLACQILGPSGRPGLKCLSLSLSRSLCLRGKPEPENSDHASQETDPSAERWGNLSKNYALQNFDSHSFRAAFQMVIDRYCPDALLSNPSIGRQGKALRRRKMRRDFDFTLPLDTGGSTEAASLIVKEGHTTETPVISYEAEAVDGRFYDSLSKDCTCVEFRKHSFPDTDIVASHKSSPQHQKSCFSERFSKYTLFKEFCSSGFDRIEIKLPDDNDLLGIWEEAQPYTELVGPYWTIRAALGPLLETYLLLDRLLFLQEQCSSTEVMMFPLFDPVLSPRNMVIIARK